MKEHRALRGRRSVFDWLVLGGAGLAILVALLGYGRGNLSPAEPRGRPLTRPLRAEVVFPSSYGQLLLGLRVHHYRPQPQGEAKFREIVFDTEHWDLHRRGYSYRFRSRLEGSGGAKYSLRFEQHLGSTPPENTALDLTADLPDALGAAIEAGGWERALLTKDGVAPVGQLHAVMAGFGLQPASLRPRLVAELDRARFDISDKGRNWFELDHEFWTFRSFERGADSPSVRFEDVVIDTRLGGEDRELYRRVHTMREFVKMIHGIRPQDRAPHARAVEALAP